jgi:hypothetical protein
MIQSVILERNGNSKLSNNFGIKIACDGLIEKLDSLSTLLPIWIWTDLISLIQQLLAYILAIQIIQSRGKGHGFP